MSKPTSFHVRHDLQPPLAYELITLLGATSVAQTQEDLQCAAEGYGYRLCTRKDYNKLIKSLVELGIIAQTGKHLQLSTIGRTVARMTAYQRELLPDFIHYLYYVGYDTDPHQRFSWSYQQVCDSLWRAAPSHIDRDRLVNLVTQQAADHFRLSGISFSISSVAGILNWLTELVPACIYNKDKGQQFTRRSYCSPELFMLALQHVFHCQRTEDTLSVPISTEFREAVCRICLLSQDAFPEMLNQVEVSFASVQVRRERGDKLAIVDFTWAQLEN